MFDYLVHIVQLIKLGLVENKLQTRLVLRVILWFLRKINVLSIISDFFLLWLALLLRFLKDHLNFLWVDYWGSLITWWLRVYLIGSSFLKYLLLLSLLLSFEVCYGNSRCHRKFFVKTSFSIFANDYYYNGN